MSLSNVDNRHIAHRLEILSNELGYISVNTDKVSKNLFMAMSRVLRSLSYYYENKPLMNREQLEKDAEFIKKICLMYEELSR